MKCRNCGVEVNERLASPSGALSCRNCGAVVIAIDDRRAALDVEAPAAALLAALRARGIHSATIAPGGPGARGCAVALAGERIQLTHVAGSDSSALRGALEEWDAHAELAERLEKERR